VGSRTTVNVATFLMLASHRFAIPAGICEAHFERTGASVPAYKLGLCFQCFAGEPIRPGIENLGQNFYDSSSEEGKSVNGTDSVSSKVSDHQASVSPSEPATDRLCGVEECRERLGPQNKSGFCRRHFHRSESKSAKKSSRTNGHASAKSPGKTNRASQLADARANGHAKNGFHKNGANGHSLMASAEILKPAGTGELLTEERVNSVLLAWPLDTKRKCLNAWLDGAI